MMPRMFANKFLSKGGVTCTRNKQTVLFLLGFTESPLSTIADFAKSRSPEEQYGFDINNIAESEEENKSEKIQQAQEIMDSLPEELSEVFYLRHVSELKLQEIAEVIGKSEATVRDRLKRADDAISQRVKRTIVTGLVAGISSEYVNALTLQAQAKALELYPEAAFISVPVAATTVTGAGAGKAVLQSVASFCAAVALPFLWIISLLIGTRMCGAAFVYNAPTLRVRRWVLEQLLYCYCGITAFIGLRSALNTLTSQTLGHNQYSNTVLSTISWIIFGTIFLYFGWARDKYSRIMKSPQLTDHGEEQAFQHIRRKTFACFCGTTVLLLTFLTWLFFTTINPFASHKNATANQEHAGAALILFAIFAVIILIFHTGTFVRFRRFLSISENEETFSRTAPDIESIPRVRDVSMVLLCLFAIVTLVPSVLHILLIREQMVYSCGEFAVFAILWRRIYQRNRQTGKHRELRIAAMFLFQIAIMQFVREYFFV